VVSAWPGLDARWMWLASGQRIQLSAGLGWLGTSRLVARLVAAGSECKASQTSRAGWPWLEIFSVLGFLLIVWC